MAGREIERERGVAERELLAIGRHHITARLLDDTRRVRNQVPVHRRHDDSGTKMILQIFGAAYMVDVAVEDERIFDLSWVEAEFPQTADDLVLHRVTPDGVDDDDALGRGDGPRRIFLLPDEIEIIEH